MYEKIMLWIVTCGILFFSNGAWAEVVLDQSQAEYDLANSGFPSTAEWVGQTVTPTGNYLESVDVFITAGSPPWDAILEIYGQTEDNGFSLSNRLASNTLTSITSQNITKYTFKFNHIDISGFKHTAGTGRLLLVLKSNSTGSGRYIFFKSGNPYDRGIQKYTPDSGTNWVARAGAMTFNVYTSNTSVKNEK